MPLLDHFHPPLSNERHPQSMYLRWLTALADSLNTGNRLPEYHVAEMSICIGGRAEDETEAEGPYRPPPPAHVMPFFFPDEVEVLVYNTEGGPTVVAAIELVTPRNKGCAEGRKAVAARCATHLQKGIGLVVVDIVSNCEANIHDELIRLMGHSDAFTFPGAAHLYVTAYHPVRRESRNEVDVWTYPLAVGKPLPIVPLAIRRVGCVPLDLEATYTEARQRSLLG